MTPKECPDCGRLNYTNIHEDGMHIDGHMTYFGHGYKCPCGCEYMYQWFYGTGGRMVKLVTHKFLCFTCKRWEQY